MRDIATMKENTWRLVNHEYWQRYKTQELMKLKMDNLSGVLEWMSVWDIIFHIRKYKKLIKQYKLCKRIADRMGWEMSYWQGLDKK